MPFLIYSFWRLALLFVSAGVLYALGMRDWLLWVVAIFVALLASYVLLSGPRDRAAEYLAARRTRRDAGHRFSTSQEEDFEGEDDAIEAATGTADDDVDTSGEPPTERPPSDAR